MHHLPIRQIEAINDIYKKIIKLPPLNLKEKLLSRLANFIDYQDIQSFEQLNTLLTTEDGKWLRDQPNSAHILAYLKEWLALGAVMVECVKYFRTLWSNQIGKPFGSDALVPLLMELLPDDKAQLKVLQKPLAVATQVSFASMYACYLTNLAAAVSVKMTDLSYQAEKDVKNMALEIKRLNIMTQLHLSCIEYLDQLLGTIRKSLVVPGAPRYLIDIPENENEALQLLNAIQADEHASEVTPLLHQYRIIWDLNISLLRGKKTSEQRLSEFIAKLEHLHKLDQPVLDKVFLLKLKTILNPTLQSQLREPFLTHAFNFFKRREAVKVDNAKNDPPVNPTP